MDKLKLDLVGVKMMETNYIPYELLLAGYENLSWIGKLRWNYYEIKHKISMLFKEH